MGWGETRKIGKDEGEKKGWEKHGKQGKMKGRGLKTVTIEEVFYKMRYIRGGRDERKGMKGRRG